MKKMLELVQQSPQPSTQ